jgi:hypothetical protein
MTVNPDGSYQAMTPGGPVTGKFVRVTDGKAVYQSSRGVNGTATLHEANGKRILRTKADDGLTSELTAAK